LKFKRYQPSTISPNNEQRTTNNGHPSTINYNLFVPQKELTCKAMIFALQS